jgi:hypothetical protein
MAMTPEQRDELRTHLIAVRLLDQMTWEISDPDAFTRAMLDLLDQVDALETENARLRRPTYCETLDAYGYRCELPESDDGTA